MQLTQSKRNGDVHLQQLLSLLGVCPDVIL